MSNLMKDMIINNLKNNGFPNNSVSLPLEKLYEVADKKGENLNQILKELEAEGTLNNKTADKIIFKTSAITKDINPEMMKKAEEMMGNLDPSKLQEIQEKVASMSAEDKEKLMNQAKNMGLF